SIEEADVVLDCTGTFATHRWLGEGGIPALGEIAASKHISYIPDDILGKQKARYAGKSVIVVGGGYSAATSISNLAQLAEQDSATWIIWLNRGTRSTPLVRIFSDTFRSRDRLSATVNGLANRGEGHIEYHAQTAIQAIECHGPDKGFRVSARCGNEEMVWEVERLIANVGYVPDLSFCRELHVVEPDDKYGLIQPEPYYYMLGAKSYGRDSQFLLQRGFEQVREVFARLTGKPKLDLYQGNLAKTLRAA
ncbi:MAG: monooxygenase, partial [Planctomycetes bacterium]|nr:monooxygenase [Planctomycetota bacterium]